MISGFSDLQSPKVIRVCCSWKQSSTHQLHQLPKARYLPDVLKLRSFGSQHSSLLFVYYVSTQSHDDRGKPLITQEFFNQTSSGMKQTEQMTESDMFQNFFLLHDSF